MNKQKVLTKIKTTMPNLVVLELIQYPKYWQVTGRLPSGELKIYIIKRG